MLMLILFGILLSGYFFYKNKYNIILNIAKLSMKLENILLEYKGVTNTFLVPDYDNNILIELPTQYYIENYIKENVKYSDYLFIIQKINYKNNIFCNIKNAENIINIESNTIPIDENTHINSPIILCIVTIYNTLNNEVLLKEYDVTNYINYLIFNKEVELTNDLKQKYFWIAYLNYFLKERNSYISTDSVENLKFEWKIMKDNLEELHSENITITNKENKLFIKEL